MAKRDLHCSDSLERFNYDYQAITRSIKTLLQKLNNTIDEINFPDVTIYGAPFYNIIRPGKYW